MGTATQILSLPFVQIALPIMLTMFIALFVQNRAFDAINQRLDEIIKRLDRIDTKLDDHATRIARLEERTSPLQTARR